MGKQMYITVTHTVKGLYRIVLVWNGMDFVKRGVLSVDETRKFITWAKSAGIPYVKTDKNGDL